MRLFGKLADGISRFDRAEWLTLPFDQAFHYIFAAWNPPLGTGATVADASQSGNPPILGGTTVTTTMTGNPPIMAGAEVD